MTTMDLFESYAPVSQSVPVTSRHDADSHTYVWVLGRPIRQPYYTNLLDGIRDLLVNGSIQIGALFRAFHGQHA